ncbi:glycosyltransferase family 2 protein [Geomonas nitrogeniifigens]|uniref:Glycosyltransferase family 2 protein n=1 Tax=Geomonas diazotrophica TaxID=2843197 RepID=A0ABX8JQY3_9BACT|nr:glycosyltransferase family A protein [Geomonas nitrogeniifigens]QWV99039.1 glycosyltransferase family 2 protein [Geomonas nitrogeniifigens]QXE88205.1 glycosyltransferase family 2 protein [Geomonas nitrogeniifigens]
MPQPLVSILLPVYNAEPYLAEAIDSLLAQTFTDFELIVVNDGSTDGSAKVIARYADPRIRLLEQENRGLSPSLNRAISVSRGRYLARQDADDISYPERLAKQVDFLERHPDCGLLGTWADIYVGSRRTERAHQHPCDNAALKFNLLCDNYFVHSSVMMRRSVQERVGLYAAEADRQPEDFDLWSRFVRDGDCRIGNLPERLVGYREVEGSICRTAPQRITDGVVRICGQNIAFASGLSPDDRTVADLAALLHCSFGHLTGEPEPAPLFALVTRLGASLAGEAEDPALLAAAVRRMRLRLVKALLIYKAWRLSRRLPVPLRRNGRVSS